MNKLTFLPILVYAFVSVSFTGCHYIQTSSKAIYPIDSFSVWLMGNFNGQRLYPSQKIEKRVITKKTKGHVFLVLLTNDTLVIVNDNPLFYSNVPIPGFKDSLEIRRYYSEKYNVDFDFYSDSTDNAPYFVSIWNTKDTIYGIRDLPRRQYSIYKMTLRDTLVSIGNLKAKMHKECIFKTFHMPSLSNLINTIILVHPVSIKGYRIENYERAYNDIENIVFHIKEDTIETILINTGI